MRIRYSLKLCSLPMLPAVILALTGAVCNAQAVQFAASKGSVGIGFESPQGLAVDMSGNVYVADSSIGSVFKIAPGCQSTSCQSIVANDLNQPMGLAVDPAGNLYIADTGNSRVLKLPPGCAQDSCATAVGSGFSRPEGVAIDSSGDVFVTDSGTNRVWKITSATSMTLWLSNLTDPTGIAFDSGGNGYVTETGKNDVVQIPSGCATVACQVIEGSGLNRPTFLSVSSATNTIYVTDSGNGRILTLGPTNQQTVVLGGLINPSGIAGNGATLFEVDAGSKGKVNVLNLGALDFASAQVGQPGATQTLNLTFSEETTIGHIAFLTEGQAGREFVDTGNGTCKPTVTYSPNESCTLEIQFNAAMPGPRRGAVEVFDSAGNSQGYRLVFGTGLSPLVAFETPLTPTSIGGTWGPAPKGAAIDGAGNLFLILSDDTPYYDPVVKGNQPGTGEVWMIRAGCYNPGSACDSLVPGSWHLVTSIALDGAGALYVADSRTVATSYGAAAAVSVTKIRRIGESGINEVLFEDVQTNSGLDDDIRPFSAAIAVDASGSLFIAETVQYGPHARRGQLLTRRSIGNSYEPVRAYPTVLTAPHALVLDAAGTPYLLDGASVFSIAPSGSKTQLQLGLAAPSGLAIDAAGALYVADQGNLWRVPPGCNSQTCEAIVQQGFDANAALTIDDNGNLFVSDATSGQFLEVYRGSLPPLSFQDTYIGGYSSDSPRNIAVANIGNEPLTLAAGDLENPSLPRGFPETLVPNMCMPATSVQPGSACNNAVLFQPYAAGLIQGSIDFADNSLNQVIANQTISVQGRGLKLLQTVTFLLPPTVTFGAAPIPLTAVATSKLPVIFAVLSGPAVINGSSLVITGAGTVLVEAYQNGNDVYNASPTVTQTVVVAKATPRLYWASPAPILYGVPLSRAQLDALPSVSGTIVYTPSSGTILPAGTQVLTATFTPLDSADYNTVTSTVNLQVTSDQVHVVTGSVTVTAGALHYDSRTGTGRQVITITNSSSSPITGPIELALSINGPATAANATGTFGGNPYWSVRSGALAPGASATIHVTFSYAPSASFNTTAIVYSGTL
jgi:sugar lactone lactonase YvrE